MRAPLSWIREFAPVDADAAAVAEALDHLGFEVEGVDEPGEGVEGVIAARALEVRPHPNADRLRLVDVDFGGDPTTVVCGATNVVAGMVMPYAGVGATLPGLGRMARRTIRGVVSDGMLCAPDELGLGDDHAGILELPAGTEPGADVRDVLGLGDVVFDLSITPNRPDAMCIVGLARELAAHFGVPLAVPPADVRAEGRGVVEHFGVDVEAVDRCPRYLARVASVTPGPSPGWLARRLTLAGMRPISNVVDVTNYVLLERNQPLHAFDLDRLAGPGIVVRLAAEGETLTTLDGVDRALTPEDLLICDAERAPQALAGIMGGGGSEVSDRTARVLLEAAYFAPMGIARTSKRLGLRSESSHRFERGIDPDAVAASAARACELLEQVAGGRVSPELVDAFPRPTARRRITLRTERVARVLGVDVDAAGVRTALEPLGIDVQGGPDFTVTAPTWRPDLEREIDLVEEVGRRIGLASIPQTLPAVTQTGGLTGRQRDRRVVVDALAGFGCSEAVTVPLIAPAQLERLGLPTRDLVEAVNSLRADETVLRPWILPGLLGVVERNAAHGLVDVAVFEVGHVFRPPRPGDVLPDERDHLAVILAGHVRRRPVEPDRPVDGYDVADAVRVLGDALGLAALALRPGKGPGFVPGRSAEVRLDGTVIGHAGELVGVNRGDALVGLELDLDALLAGTRRDRTFRQPSRAPSSTVDLAFELPEGVPAAEVAGTIAAAGGEVVEAVDLFDEFRSEALGEGRRSLAYRVRYRAPDHTLTAEEIGTLRQAAIDAVTATHRAELRGEGG